MDHSGLIIVLCVAVVLNYLRQCCGKTTAVAFQLPCLRRKKSSSAFHAYLKLCVMPR